MSPPTARCGRSAGGADPPGERWHVDHHFFYHYGSRRQLIRQDVRWRWLQRRRSEEHTSELQSLMRISYAVFCWKKKKSDKLRITSATHSTYYVTSIHLPYL